MKKIAFFAFAALALFSCAKEVEAPVDAPAVKTHTVTIKAGFDAETKTAYDGQGKFSWVEGDKIGVLITDGTTVKQVPLTAQASGASVEFKGEVENGFELEGTASYPFTEEMQGYARNDLAWDAEKGGWRLWGSIKPSLETPLASTPLLGFQLSDDNDYYTFKTATGIVKFTVENVPVETNFAFLEIPEDKDGYLNGWFGLDADGYLKMSNPVEGWKDRYNWNVPTDVNTTMDYYFFIPVGTIPAGTKFELCNSSWAAIQSFELKQDVEVVRNAVVNIAKVTVPPVEGPKWESMGNGKFIDTFVWSENGLGSNPVEVEFFEDVNNPGNYKIQNPYAAVAANGVVAEGADEFLVFSIADKGRISWEWCNMGLSISKNAEKKWAMISGQDVAGYGNDNSHVVSVSAEGKPIQVQLAPCYRTSDENQTGEPTDYANEVGKDHDNGIVEIVFPGNDLMMPMTVSQIKVSTNQSGDGQGAAGLIDNSLSTFWHSPWESASTTFDTVYGEYAEVVLANKVNKLAFNYCTRSTASQDGSPAIVVVGGSNDGKTWTEIATFELASMLDVTANTWVGLPVVDASGYGVLRFGIAKNKKGEDLRNITSADQWCNLAELLPFGISEGENDFEYLPDLEEGQVWVKEEMITAADVCTHDGDGVAALVDFDYNTYWHSNWYYAVTGNDSVYGIFFDIALKEALKDFHFEYVVRAGSNGARPTAIILAVSNDGETWTKVADLATEEMQNAAAGARVKLPTVNADAAYKYLRFGITDSANTDEGSLTGDLNFNGYKKCVNLAELLLFNDGESAGDEGGSGVPDYDPITGFEW